MFSRLSHPLHLYISHLKVKSKFVKIHTKESLKMKGECIPVYTDGGASPNPGPGGWGWVALHETLSGTKMLYLCYGGEEHTTNNRMELMAMIDFVENACEDTNYT